MLLNSNVSYANNESISDFTPMTAGVEDDNSASSQTIRFISKAYLDKKNESKILEAETFYKEFENAFKTGNFKDTKKYFNLFLEEIDNIETYPDIYFFLYENMRDMITKLKSVYCVHSSSNGNYSIPMTTKDNSIIEKHISIYSSGKTKNRVKTALERSGAYKDIVLKTLREFNLPEELFYLPIVESLYDLNTVSRAGAVGI
jgi:membrane-bound lytic murein transglycosylase D